MSFENMPLSDYTDAVKVISRFNEHPEYYEKNATQHIKDDVDALRQREKITDHERELLFILLEEP